MTVPDTAAALNEPHTRLAEVEELINGSAESGLSVATTRLTLIDQLLHRTGTLSLTTNKSMRIRGKETSDFIQR